MKRSSKQFIVAYIIIAGGLWGASQWWEKALAKNLGDPDVSPNGCYRIESYKPFWILPYVFHSRSHPDELGSPEWFPWWGYPVFFRLYNHHSGELISETDIFDFDSTGGAIIWGEGVRRIFYGAIPIGHAPECGSEI